MRKIAIALVLLAPALDWSAADTKFVSVSGYCMKRVSPDRGTLNMSAEAKEDDPTAASQKATKLYDKLRAEVKKLNLKDTQMQTSHYNVHPEYDYNNGKQKLRGYRATMGIEIETADISRMGELIDTAAKLGIQNAGGFNTFLSPEKQRETHEGCLEEAIKNARSKAEKLARAGGAKLGDVLTIEESRSERRPPSPPIMLKAASMELASDSGGGAGIETKNAAVEVTVAVSFALK